jgi:hypothetical protein
MEKSGESPPAPISGKSYSGKFVVRIPPEVHRALAIKAAEQGISIRFGLLIRESSELRMLSPESMLSPEFQRLRSSSRSAKIGPGWRTWLEKSPSPCLGENPINQFCSLKSP